MAASALLGAFGVSAQAQTADQVDQSATIETVTVTGYRASLTAAVDAKRAAPNFTDSIFAEDIGKFPDNNIAEAINRIPGIQLTRDRDGEGVQISVLGLGPSFTEVLMNDTPIAVATDGTTGSGNSNRETDLDMFPVELFTKVTVAKTPTAHTVEGGIAGTVNMQNIRPFDNPDSGFHLTYSLQDKYSSSGGSFSPRGALIAQYNWGENLGVLFGFVGEHLLWRTDGYENVGDALADVAVQQPGCAAATPNPCGTIGTGRNFRWATVVPAGLTASQLASAGLTGYTAGQPYNYAGGLTTPGGTSGLSIAGLSNVVFPYLGREIYRGGSKDQASFLFDTQWRASDDLQANLSVLYESEQRDNDQEDMDWYVRNSCNPAGTASSCMVPVNVTADSQGHLTSGTFLNSNFFLEAAPFRENVQFLNINPTIDWTPKSWLKIHGSIDYDESSMNRQEWSYLVQTPQNAGYSATYSMSPNQDFPTISTNAPLNDPNGGWEWYSVRVQPLYRNTQDSGTNWDATIGNDDNNLKVGYSYQRSYRNILARDNSANAQACVTGVGTCTLPAGVTTQPIITNAQLSQYLAPLGKGDFAGMANFTPGFASFIKTLPSLDKATDIQQFLDSAPFSGSGAVGAQKSGQLDEQTQGAYIELNEKETVMGHDIHVNAGVRYVNTLQKITGPATVGGVPNVYVSNSKTYDEFLPSFNFSANITDDVLLRLAGSRTMTRAIPSAMLPGATFGSALLSPISAGNPNLAPYFSNNFDLGVEWYTGGPGVLSFDFFNKELSNFTQSQQIIEPFSATGIPVAELGPSQLADYNTNGGQNELVTVNTTVNLQQKLHLQGFEAEYVQPLDYFVPGLGLTATFTRTYYHVDAGLTAAQAQGIATGIAPYTYNLGAYYENSFMSLRLNYNYITSLVTGAVPASQGIQQAGYSAPYGELDFSSSYTIPWFDGTVLKSAEITFDGTNLLDSIQKGYIGNVNNPGTVYYPGHTFILGFRGKF